MPSYSFIFVVILLCVINVDSRRHSQKHRIRALWQKIKESTANKFNIDLRLFDKEYMLLFPDVAYQTSANADTWHIMLHGWRFEKNRGKDWFGFSTSKWIERLAHQVLSPSEVLYLNGSINRDRLKPFFVEDEANELIQLKIGDKTHSVRTDQSGQFYERFEATNDEIQKLKQQQKTTDFITYEATGDNKDQATGVIRLIEPREGISVISDIDDTIKISEVLDKVRLLANTFIYPFKPVPGKHDKFTEYDFRIMSFFFRYRHG
jgi:hypothetical protein